METCFTKVAEFICCRTKFCPKRLRSNSSGEQQAKQKPKKDDKHVKPLISPETQADSKDKKGDQIRKKDAAQGGAKTKLKIKPKRDDEFMLKNGD